MVNHANSVLWGGLWSGPRWARGLQALAYVSCFWGVCFQHRHPQTPILKSTFWKNGFHLIIGSSPNHTDPGAFVSGAWPASLARLCSSAGSTSPTPSPFEARCPRCPWHGPSPGDFCAQQPPKKRGLYHRFCQVFEQQKKLTSGFVKV